VLKRLRQANRAKKRHEVELLESRELLTTVLEGVAAADLAGSALTPLGNIFDDPAAGLVGDDFAIGAPGAGGGRGEVYVVLGGPGLNATSGCTPPGGVQNCTLINDLLTAEVALRIRGEAMGDNAGYSVAGLGDVVGDSRPDLMLGSPFADPQGVSNAGRAYLLGGDFLATVISTARATAGNTTPIISLNCNPVTVPIPTIRCFDGRAANDEAGNSVAGIGTGFFMVGAPGSDTGGKDDRGEVYIFGSLRGTTGSGFLTPFSTLRGPSVGGHLGGVPAAELTGTSPYRGSAISGIKHPALVPLSADLSNNRIYNVLDTIAPDILVGAPDACQLDTCNMAATDRNGRVYLLSGQQLLNTGGIYDLSVDTTLKELAAIVVQGASVNDRLGTAVASAGDLDGDIIDANDDGVPDAGSGFSDFMFSAPNRDIPGPTPGSEVSNAGEVTLVFGREVNSNPFNDGMCFVQPGASQSGQQNFRQCRRGANDPTGPAGSVTTLNTASFIQSGNLVGLTLQGETANERAGMSIAEAGNFLDPVGLLAATQPALVGVNEILVGAPLRDVTTVTGTFMPAAGRAYLLLGTRDYQGGSGIFRNLGLLDDIGLGRVFNGRAANDNYGIAVASAGNPHDPVGVIGDDILIGGFHVDPTINNVVAANAGEVEILFGSTAAGLGTVFVPSLLPFTQPGPFGPQVFAAGFWSFTNATPPAGSSVHFPITPSGVSNIMLFPPATPFLTPPGTVGPFVPAFPLGAALFIPDRPAALVDRAGNVNVYGANVAGGRGINLTATLRSPRVRTAAVTANASDGTTSIFAVDQTGHLIHHRGDGENWYAVDLTIAANGPSLTGSVSVQRFGTSFVVSGRSVSGQLVIYAGSDAAGWQTADVSASSGTSLAGMPGPMVASNYAINSAGHLIEYVPSKRRFKATDITAASRGPLVQGDIAASISVFGGRASFEVFARSTNNHLIRYFRVGRAWQAEDVSAQLAGSAGSQIDGSILVGGSVGARTIYAQSGGRIIEISSDWFGWISSELPLPAGTTSVLGPIAASGGASRTVYAYQAGGSLVEYTNNGSWQVRLLNANNTASTALDHLLDVLADLGVQSR